MLDFSKAVSRDLLKIVQKLRGRTEQTSAFRHSCGKFLKQMQFQSDEGSCKTFISNNNIPILVL